MNYLDTFLIPFKGLKNGEHKFTFDIEHPFFEAFNKQSDIIGEFHVDLILLKETRMMVLTFDIKGQLDSECHLCLEPFKMKMEEKKELIVKFGDEASNENDEVMVLNESSVDLNIAQAIYDFIILSVPLRIVHPEKDNGEPGCNEKALKKIDKYLQHDKTNDNSRWQALKKLKFD